MKISSYLEKGRYVEGLEIIRASGDKNTVHYEVEHYNHMGEYRKTIDRSNEYLTTLAKKTTTTNKEESSFGVKISNSLLGIERETFRSEISVRISLIFAYLKLNNVEKAQQEMEKLSGQLPESHFSLIADQDLDVDLLTSPANLVTRLYEILGKFAYAKNKNIEAIGYYLLGYELSITKENSYWRMKLAYDLAISYGLTGNLEMAREKNREAIDLALAFDNKQGQAYTLGWMATWDFIKFDLVEMEKKLQSIVNLASDLFDKQPVIFAHIYLSFLENLRGHTNQAEIYIHSSLDMINNVDNKEYLPLALFYQGIIRRTSEDYSKSVEAFLQAISIHQVQTGYDEQRIVSLANVYYHLFHTYMDLGNNDDATSILQQLDTLLDKSRNAYVNIMQKTAHAAYLRSLNTLSSKVDAIEILRSLVSLPMFERGRFVSIYAMFLLYELQLDEYLVTNEEELLHANNGLLNRISDLIKAQGLWHLYGDVLVLNFKFHLITGNLQQSKEVIDEIRTLATSRDLTFLHRKVQDLEHELIQEVERIDSLIQSHKRLIEQYKLDEMKEYLKSVGDMFKRG